MTKKKKYFSKGSKQYWLNKGFSEEEALLHSKENRKIFSEYWLKRGYSEEESKKLSRGFRKNSKEYWIRIGLTEQQAQEKQRQFNRCNKEYWKQRGYSDKESIELSKQCKTIKNRGTIKYWLLKGFSREDAIKNANLYNRSKNKRYIEYWMRKGYTKNQAIILSKEQKPSCKEYWLKRGYSESISKNKAKYCRCPCNSIKVRSSKIETKCFDELSEYLKIKISRQHWTNINGMVFCQDGRYKNIVFEFNGTNFHLDDRFHDENSKSPYGKDYKTVKEHDKLKLDSYKNKGYNTIIIWEHDYKKNKKLLFENIKQLFNSNFINGKSNSWDSSVKFPI